MKRLGYQLEMLFIEISSLPKSVISDTIEEVIGLTSLTVGEWR